MALRGAGSGTRHGCAPRTGAAMAPANTSRRTKSSDNQPTMRCNGRKRCREVLRLLTHIRSTYPRATCLYLVLDNVSPHKRREVTDWAADHNVELVFTPTYASWLNRIEAIFSGVSYFALANSDYPDHVAQPHERSWLTSCGATRHRHTELVKRLEKLKISFAARHSVTGSASAYSASCGLNLTVSIIPLPAEVAR